MPSSRFFKLPDEKRSKILRAVHSELAEFPVDELSINRIIHSAGISRGSFYQYFEDKDDLLEYVFSDFRNSMTQEIKASIERWAAGRKTAGFLSMYFCMSRLRRAVLSG